MRFAVLISLALLLIGVAPLPSASPAAPAAASPGASSVAAARNRLESMLRQGHADPAWFAAGFLEQVPVARVNEILATLSQTLGAFQGVDALPDRFVAHFAKGTDDVIVHMDADDRIDGLLFKPPAVAAASLQDALVALRQPNATLSYVVEVAGEPDRASLEPALPLAVGSAFKLAVLDALADQVARGRRRWGDVLTLQARWKSLPSGVLRTWPDGTPLTLVTYAAEMISISDNSAADALIRLLGQKALEPYAGSNRPFLTTREAFVLKAASNAGLRNAYVAASTPLQRSAVLARADRRPLPPASEISGAPSTDIEWHYSARALCALMRKVAAIPLMSINPGLADSAAFRHVAFKDGSDAGVLNLTTMVTTKKGTQICFAATINASGHDVNAASFETAYAAALSALANL